MKQNKKLIALLILITVFGCGLKKPFVIVNKYDKPFGRAEYWYQDERGTQANFYDSANKYNIGDTLK